MTYKIKVDVLSSVKDFYPGLSVDDAELIAEDITWYANGHDIDLEGKDGLEIEEPDRFNRDAGSIARQRLVNNNIHVLNAPNSPLFP